MSAAQAKPRPVRRSFGFNKIFLILAIIYLLVPLVATLFFGLAGSGGIDFSTFQQIIGDPNFRQTLILSLELAFSTTILAIVLVTPTAYWVHLRVPKARPLMDFLTLMPFAVPAIIMSLGLVELYGTNDTLTSVLSFGLVPVLSYDPFNIIDTPQLLVCAYVILSLPFVYRPIDNSLRAINTTTLTEAAYSLGSGWWRTFLTVVLPNIWPGIISAALLTFSTVMGEFTLASLFGIFTFPIYLDEIGQENAREAASLAILSFIFTLICVLAIIFLVRRSAGRIRDDSELEIVATK
jgi:putative spermidine/putrescine transport system permease protein